MEVVHWKQVRKRSQIAVIRAHISLMTTLLLSTTCKTGWDILSKYMSKVESWNQSFIDSCHHDASAAVSPVRLLEVFGTHGGFMLSLTSFLFIQQVPLSFILLYLLYLFLASCPSSLFYFFLSTNSWFSLFHFHSTWESFFFKLYQEIHLRKGSWSYNHTFILPHLNMFLDMNSWCEKCFVEKLFFFPEAFVPIWATVIKCSLCPPIITFISLHLS